MTDDRLSPIARAHLAQCRAEVEAARKRAEQRTEPDQTDAEEADRG